MKRHLEETMWTISTQLLDKRAFTEKAFLWTPMHARKPSFLSCRWKILCANIPGHDGWGVLEQEPQSQVLRGLGAPSEESASSYPVVGHRLLTSDQHRNQPGRWSQAAGEIPQVKLFQAGLCPPSPEGLSLRLPRAKPH